MLNASARCCPQRSTLQALILPCPEQAPSASLLQAQDAMAHGTALCLPDRHMILPAVPSPPLQHKIASPSHMSTQEPAIASLCVFPSSGMNNDKSSGRTQGLALSVARMRSKTSLLFRCNALAVTVRPFQRFKHAMAMPSLQWAMAESMLRFAESLAPTKSSQAAQQRCSCPFLRAVTA